MNERRVEDPEVLQRIKGLAIPPAWIDVWICPVPNGHLQAVGTDAAGRKQYLYHDRWRARKDQEKFDRMLEFARGLPGIRRRLKKDLELDGLPAKRVLACTVRLLDRGFFRIGTESYAEKNDTYGLATIRKEHVKLEGNLVRFDYPAKGGQRRLQSIVDPAVAEIVGVLKKRRSGPPDLLAYKSGRRWMDVKSQDINDYIKVVSGGEFTAKDFRTWNATVLASVALAVSGNATGSLTARKRAEARAVKEVAHYLGNTPAVCRSSYIDPKVFDRFRSGWTIAMTLESLGNETVFGDLSTQGVIEEAVLDLLEKNYDSAALERVA